MSGKENSNVPGDSVVLERLSGLLETHGSDQRRWPDGAAAAMAPVLARSAAARRLLAEAEALDRLLALTPGPAAAPDGTASLEFTSRIVREAMRDAGRETGLPGAAARGALPGAPVPRRAVQHPAAARDGASYGNAGRGLAAGILAASVLFGVWLGTDSRAAPWIDTVLGASSLDQTADADLFEELNGAAEGQGELL